MREARGCSEPVDGLHPLILCGSAYQRKEREMMDEREMKEIPVVESGEPRAAGAASASASSGNATIEPPRRREHSPAIAPAKAGPGALPPQADPAPCPTCSGPGMEGAMATASYVY